MPGFIGHTTGNAVVFVSTTAVMASQGWSLGDIIAVDAGIVIANFILSPDLDLFNSRSMVDWGWMRLFWWPYAKMVKHRDMMHLPVIGTLVRWIYMVIVLAIVVVPIMLLLQRMNFTLTFRGGVSDILWYLGYLADLLIGATLADAMHYILDMISTRIKRLIPRRFRERYERYAMNHHERDHQLAGNRWSEPGSTGGVPNGYSREDRNLSHGDKQ